MILHRNELDVTSLERPKGQISFRQDAGLFGEFILHLLVKLLKCPCPAE